MTLAEKLRFLADRAEDGQEFYVTTYEKDVCKSEWEYNEFFHNFYLSDLEHIILELVPQWEFTEDEKVILRNLPNKFTWIARDRIGNELFVYTSKPTKSEQSWSCMDNFIRLTGFRHLFEPIQWSDDEPCEFRKYL